MDYHKHYSVLISRAINRSIEGYKESHHIIPRCLNGTDDLENIIDLTAREHFIAHQLLVKMYPGNRNLIFALARMTDNKGRIPDRSRNRIYEWMKIRLAREMSELMKGRTKENCEAVARMAKTKTGKKFSAETIEKLRIRSKARYDRGDCPLTPGFKDTPKIRENISRALTGRELSSEHKANLSKSATGRVMSEDTRKKMGESHLGRKHSEETKNKIRLARLGKKRGKYNVL